VTELAKEPSLVLLCGRYEGIDERLVDDFVDEEVSMGDFVVSGGELPAMLLLDAIIRLIPGALGDNDSAQQDSFAGSGLLDYPHYTRPEELDGVNGALKVPDVLLSGDHAKIASWRKRQALERTLNRRPDLLQHLVDENKLSVDEQQLLKTLLNS
jgi:tRNA (guanine37-N1)-methyltransferase